MLKILGIILFWPLMLAWLLAGLVFKLLGKLITIAIGTAILVIGLILCITIIAIPFGIILVVLGLTLIIKGIF